MKTPAFLNNVIIVTGASSGIGRQMALQLAGQGALLALAARNTKKLKEVVMSLQGKLGLWMRLIAPGAVDRMSKKAPGNRQPVFRASMMIY